MTTLFQRKVRVLLATPHATSFSKVSAEVREITELRVSFKVSKALTKDPNTCEIKIYNLAESTRKALPGTGAKVVLHAGYEGALEQLFIGDARTIESKREGTEWVTTVKCGDGERAVKFARFSGSFAANTQVAEVIKTIGKATKLDTGNIEKIASGLPPSLQYTQGKTSHGPALKELEKALKFAGYDLSIQDGALLALQPGEATTEEVIELSAESGLLGSPEFAAGEKKEGKNKAAAKPVLKAKSLLQGQFRCGRRVLMKSRQYSGLLRLVKLDHVGDTAGGEWASNLELEVK